MKGAGGKGDGVSLWGSCWWWKYMIGEYWEHHFKIRKMSGTYSDAGLSDVLSSPITRYYRRLILLAAMTFYLPIWMTSGSAEIFSMLIFICLICRPWFFESFLHFGCFYHLHLCSSSSSSETKILKSIRQVSDCFYINHRLFIKKLPKYYHLSSFFLAFISSLLIFHYSGIKTYEKVLFVSILLLRVNNISMNTRKDKKSIIFHGE